ncbi:GntR family transcriptional regulator [Acrocarpospora macrocephala]|uniref:GntR family transcriptional regulator n=1 Tax=Acrocarpospora macrocephala TaxID=150177 RepID=UPI0014780821|nr:GntR family transcriptional regulator [Acrocarpospora macrocephala]
MDETRARYKEIAKTLASQIKSGDFAPGAPFLHQWELMRNYRIDSSTAALVCMELKKQGLIRHWNGRAYIVNLHAKARDAAPIVAAIIEKIQSGAIGPHQRVPSLTIVQKEYSTTIWTARRAINALIESGWAYRIPYRGTFSVPEHLWPAKSTYGISPGKPDLSDCHGIADLENRLAVHLGFPEAHERRS